MADAVGTGPSPAPASGVRILGVKVHAVTYDDLLDRAGAWIASRGPHQVATVNPEFVMCARRDHTFAAVLEGADLCVADGVGLLWAARLQGARLPERVTGSDALPLLARRAARSGWRVYFLGAKPGVAERAAAVLVQRYPGFQVVGCFSGSPSPGDAPDVIGRVRAARPDLLFVAYGAPAQDVWIARHAHELEVPVMMGIGGAFDHLVGVQRRAPEAFQRAGLEWLYRLVTQPWRWRRQLALPRFVLLVLAERLRGVR